MAQNKEKGTVSLASLVNFSISVECLGLCGSKWDMHGAPPLHPHALPLPPEGKVIIPDPLQVNSWGKWPVLHPGSSAQPPALGSVSLLCTRRNSGLPPLAAAVWVPMLKRHSFGKRMLCKVICK